MSKQTAAEKFDLVPPWTEIKDGAGGRGFWVHHVHGEFVCIDTSGAWTTSKAKYHATSAEAAAAARLTIPLPSWEPAPDAPLPVEGWVVQCHDGLDGWFVYDAKGNDLTDNGTLVGMPTRTAAYVWAWTEAEADDRPITEADVKVGQVWGNHDREYTRTVLSVTDDRVVFSDRYAARNDDHVRSFLWWINAEPKSHLITDATVATDGPTLEARVSKVEGVLARICPEADEQTDGKGRTLAEIDAELEVLYRWSKVAHTAIQATQDKVDDHAARLTKLERLIAAQVAKPATLDKPHAAASANDFATAVAGADGGEQRWDCGILECEDGKYLVLDYDRRWELTADGGWDRYDGAKYGLRAEKMACVRDLRDAPYPPPTWTAKQLAAAQTAAIAAEGRADTAKKRAAVAEEALAEARASVDRLTFIIKL